MIVERRAVQHHDELGGDRAQHGHPFGLDQAQQGGGVELGHHHGGHPQDGRGVVGGPQAETERGGHRHAEHLVGPQPAVVHRLLVEVEPAVVGLHHALGPPGGPRGGVQQAQLRGSEAALLHGFVEIGHRGRGRGRLAVEPQVRPLADTVHGEVGAQGGQRVAEVGHQVARGAAVVPGTGDDGSGPGRGHQVGDFGWSGAVADAHHHHPGPIGPGEGGVDGGPVGENHRGPVAPVQTGGQQGGGHPVGQVVVVRPGGPVDAADGPLGVVGLRLRAVPGEVGGIVGALGDVAPDQVGGGVVAPPARRHVGSGHLGVGGGQGVGRPFGVELPVGVGGGAGVGRPVGIGGGGFGCPGITGGRRGH